MTFDLSKLRNTTREQLIEAAMRSMRDEDAETRRKQKFPKRRSSQESYHERLKFDNAYDAFRLRLSEHCSVTTPLANSLSRIDLAAMHVDNRYALLVIAVALPYAMVLSLSDRTRQPAHADDIAKFSHLLAAQAEQNRAVVQFSLAAFSEIAMLRIAVSQMGNHSSVILRDLMEDGRGGIDERVVFDAANETSGDWGGFYAILFDAWHTCHGLPIPSPLRGLR